ncbi:MAG: acetyl-CoA carboxylase biotin carboxyl carrier protein [Denitrovibrio sp.]|nr:MAG: acetyl-CoA carboxylase biotin carboxyl carrier protein [Denitrovibrio sp.]
MNIKEMKDLIKYIEKSDIKEFQYENEQESIYISKMDDVQQVVAQPQYAPMQSAPAHAPAAPAAAPAAEAPAAPKASGNEVVSPIVGTFYAAASPGAAPFVKEGDAVKKGQTLCIVEAMKIMNEIEAEYDCKIVKIVGQNGVPVEFGETIFVVEPL